MKKVAAAEFKAHCLGIMAEVNRTREPVLVTRRGRPLVKLVPAGRRGGSSIFNCMAGQFEIAGDIEAPVVPLEDWNALR